MNGGVGKIEMLKKTNILALVGGGDNPFCSPKKIVIYDDHHGNILSILRFNKLVLNVRLTKEKIFGIIEDKIYIFNLSTLETKSVLETYDNPNGIMGISDEENNKLIIAYPIQHQGYVNIRNCKDKKTSKESKIINAHESKLACLSVNKDGSLLATASDKGTLIRIFSTHNGENITAFRRGNTNVTMNCISFSPNNIFIGCTSNGGTIHIFSIASITKKLNENNKIKTNNIYDNSYDEPKNQKSLLAKIGGFLNINSHYVEQDRSFARFKLQEEKSLLGFGIDNTFYVITLDGKYYKVTYNPREGGECQKIGEKNFMFDIN